MELASAQLDELVAAKTVLGSAEILSGKPSLLCLTKFADKSFMRFCLSIKGSFSSNFYALSASKNAQLEGIREMVPWVFKYILVFSSLTDFI